MQIPQLIFLITWLLFAGYIFCNQMLLSRLRSADPGLYSTYQELDSLSRSGFVLSLVSGESPYQEAIVSIPPVAKVLQLSRFFFGAGLISFLAFIASLFLAGGGS